MKQQQLGYYEMNKELDSYVVLKPDIINSLLDRMKNVNDEREVKEIKETLFKTYVKLVRNICETFYRNCTSAARGIVISYRDLFQEGCCSLLKCIDTFNDKERKVKFNMYLHYELKSTLNDYYENAGSKFKVPSNTMYFCKIISSIEGEGTTGVKEVSKEFKKITGKNITPSTFLALRRLNTTVSIDQPLVTSDSSNEDSYYNLTSDDTNIETEIVNKDCRMRFRGILTSLDPRLLKALVISVESKRDKDIELTYIAKSMGLSKKQLEMMVSIKMKSLKKDKELREIYEELCVL